MNTYRVTYIESILRETSVEATDPEAAIDAARAELEDGKHHHAVDVWQDDWNVESPQPHPATTRRCFECNERLP